MRNYKKKTNFRPLTEDVLNQARALIGKGMSIRQAAKVIGFNESSLRAKFKKGKASLKLGRFRTVFSDCQEKDVLRHCIELDKSTSGFTLKSLRSLLYDFAIKNKIPNRFSPEAKLAGRDFTREFMKRHKLSLRSIPHKTSVPKVEESPQIISPLFDHYFDNLESVMKKYAFPPDRIFIMNEKIVKSSRDHQSHVESTKDMNFTKSKLLIEQGPIVSAVCSVNAMGQFVPPFFVFPSQDISKPLFMKSAPAGSDVGVTETGCMNSQMSMKWLEHFNNFTNSCSEKPILLILNKYIADVRLEETTYAGHHGIHLFLIPPNVTQKTLPLYQNLYRLLEKYHDAVDEWNQSPADELPSNSNIVEHFTTAYEKVATVENAVKGFRDIGIYPSDRDKFCFIPTEVTGQDPEDDEDDERRLIVFDCYEGVPVETVLTVIGETDELSDDVSTSASFGSDAPAAGPSTSESFSG